MVAERLGLMDKPPKLMLTSLPPSFPFIFAYLLRVSYVPGFPIHHLM